MMNRKTNIITAAALFSALCFQGCLSDETATDIQPNDERQILFGILPDGEDSSTRGTVVTLDDIPGVGLYGYHTATERWEWMAANRPAGLKPNYFCNESLLKSGAAGAYLWNYAGQPRFWPPDTRNKVSFFAYSPTGEGAVEPYPVSATETGIPVVKYTVPAAIANHLDVMRASNIDMTKYGADEVSGTADDGIVPMTMEHALTQITFSVQFSNPEDADKYSCRINSVTISGIYDKGTLRLDNGEWSFGTATDADRMSLLISGANLAGEEINDGNRLYHLLNPAIGSLMLIPQPLATANMVVNVTFTDSNPLNSPVTLPISYSLSDTGVAWEPGRAIDYRILIKGGFISVHTAITTWTAYGPALTGNTGL